MPQASRSSASRISASRGRVVSSGRSGATIVASLPSVQQTTAVVTPRLASRERVPPIVMVSSSGWACTAITRRSLTAVSLLADRHGAHDVALADRGDHVHALHHLAEEVVRLAQLVPVVDGADEELGAVGVGPGVGHGHRSGDVLALHRLVLELVAGAAPAAALRVAALDHEVIDDAMEGEPVVEAVAGEEYEVVDRLRRAGRVERDDDVAPFGADRRPVALAGLDDLLGAGVSLRHRRQSSQRWVAPRGSEGGGRGRSRRGTVAAGRAAVAEEWREVHAHDRVRLAAQPGETLLLLGARELARLHQRIEPRLRLGDHSVDDRPSLGAGD